MDIFNGIFQMIFIFNIHFELTIWKWEKNCSIEVDEEEETRRHCKFKSKQVDLLFFL